MALTLPPGDVEIGQTGHVNAHNLIVAALEDLEAMVQGSAIPVLAHDENPPAGYTGLIARLPES